jgi:peroxiredoxin
MRITKAIGMALSTTAAVSIIAVALVQNRSRAEGTSQTGQALPAPAWELQGLDGKTVNSTDFKGKVVVLDFWATWCQPCKAEIAGFIDLQKKYQAQGLAVVGISVDQAGFGAVKSFVQKDGINYPVVLADSKVVAAYGGIEAIPTTFIIDRAGRVLKQHLGFTDKEEFEKEIKALLAP